VGAAETVRFLRRRTKRIEIPSSWSMMGGDFQRGGDFASYRDKEAEMTERVPVYRDSQEQVWREFARELGAEFIAGGSMWGGDKIVVRVNHWTVILDVHTVVAGYTSITCTRIRAPYLNRDKFRFRVYHKDIFSSIGVLLGAQDVEIGNADFDREFVVKTNDEAKVRQLFSNVRVRTLLQANPSVHMLIKESEGTYGADYPPDVDELYLEVIGIVRRAERLRSLYELFSETLNHLCHLDSAYADDPHLLP